MILVDIIFVIICMIELLRIYEMFDYLVCFLNVEFMLMWYFINIFLVIEIWSSRICYLMIRIIFV